MNDFRYELAVTFAPTYRACERERCYLVKLESKKKPRILRAHPPWDPIVYFSMLELEPQEDETAYEINYFTIWDWDTGGIIGPLARHKWDTERTAILVTGPRNSKDPDAFSAQEVYYAAHEGVPFVNRSGFYRCRPRCGATVFWSFGKHASYPQLSRFPTFDRFKSPGYESQPGEYVLVDMGTLDGEKVPWILYKLPWGPKVGAVYYKLRKRIWGRDKWQKIKRRDHREGNQENRRTIKNQIKWFQRITDLPETGELDKVTLKTIYAKNLDSHLVHNFDRFSDEDSQRILKSNIKGTDIDILARAQPPSRKIEKITQKGVGGKALKDYVKART